MTAGVPRMIPLARSRASSGVPSQFSSGRLSRILDQRCGEISGLSDLRVERIEGRDRHPAPVRVPMLSNKVSVFDATGLPTLQRQDGFVQLLDPRAGSASHRPPPLEAYSRGSDPREGQSAHGEQCGTGCH